MDTSKFKNHQLRNAMPVTQYSRHASAQTLNFQSMCQFLAHHVHNASKLAHNGVSGQEKQMPIDKGKPQ
eukprot:5348175-Amphidinium_carterae.1